MHDRLPSRSEEHPHRQLPLPRRAAGRRDPTAYHRGGRPSPQEGRLRRRHGADGQVAQQADDGHGGRGRVLGRDLQHPEAAARDARDELAEDLLAARVPDPHELRGHPRRARRQADPRLHRGRRDHVVVASGREHPHRAVPLRQGQQHDGAAEHLPDRGRDAPQPVVAVSARRGAVAEEHQAIDPAQVVRAGDHPAGHAVVEQLDHRHAGEGTIRFRPAHLVAGRRRAEPDVDPRRQ